MRQSPSCVYGCKLLRYNIINIIGNAKGSIRELREDYKDFLRQQKLSLWGIGDHRTQAWRQYAGGELNVASFTQKCETKRPEVIANVMITLCCQLDAAITILMKGLESDFKAKGGIKEKLYQIRKEWRSNNQ